MSAREGPSLEKRDKVQQRQEERQHDRDLEQQRIQRAFNQDGNLSRDWMQDLLDTDDLQSQLRPGTIDKIRALLNKQWIIANLNDAETHDRKFKLEVMKHKILDSHPPDKSRMNGKLRAFLYDDPIEELHPLTQHERTQIEQVITSLQNMATRSRGGFERKQQQTSIAKTETEDQDTDGDSSGWRIFG